MTDPYLPAELPEDLINRAFVAAAHIHREDPRKGHAYPYLSHLMAVAALVWEHGGSDTQVAAALLHDTAEDHGGQDMLDELREHFSEEVVTIVEQCSDALPGEGEEKPPWMQRKVRYLAAIPAKEPKTLLVSAADKLHNARLILADYRQTREQLWSQFNRGREYQLWYYGELAQALAEALPSPLTDELQRVVGEIHHLVADHIPGIGLEIASVREEAKAIPA